MECLSNGESDGIALFYIQNKKLKAVCLKADEAEELDVLLNMFFMKRGVKIKTPDDLTKYL